MPYHRLMQFLRWLNNPISYIYVVLGIVVFFGVVTMKPSKFDPDPTASSPSPILTFFLLLIGLFLIRAAWSVIKIVGGSYSSAMTGKPERNADKPFSFWDF